MHTQFLLFSNTLLCPRNFCELVILCVMLLCPNNLVHCYRNVRETQWMPNKPKARRLWPTYRLTSVSVNTPSNSSPTQSQTKIVGTLQPNAVFFLLVLTSSLSKLFIALRSPNLVHQHWGDKKTPKCPNHFDWDCSAKLAKDKDSPNTFFHLRAHLAPSGYSTSSKANKSGEIKTMADIHVARMRKGHSLNLMSGERSGNTTAPNRSTMFIS